MNRKNLFIFLLISLFSLSLFAQYDLSGLKTSKQVIAVIESDILNWINNPEIVSAIKKANMDNKKRSSKQILKLDKEWRSGKNKALIQKTADNKASAFLKKVQAD